LPIGAIILWTDSSSCPEGFEALTHFNNLTIRGADLAGARPEVPDDPNRVCDGTEPPEAGCGSASQRYDDVLDVAELPAHHHNIVDDGKDTPESGPSDVANRFDSAGGNDPDNENVDTEDTGGGEVHFHPFATVIFCRFVGSP
jgi:hypothetical protein